QVVHQQQPRFNIVLSPRAVQIDSGFHGMDLLRHGQSGSSAIGRGRVDGLSEELAKKGLHIRPRAGDCQQADGGGVASLVTRHLSLPFLAVRVLIRSRVAAIAPGARASIHFSYFSASASRLLHKWGFLYIVRPSEARGLTLLQVIHNSALLSKNNSSLIRPCFTIEAAMSQ